MPIMAKNIKDAIAETEKNKNNLTQAKTKIDNKIQNLGGQKSANIFDIANKIEGMVNTQYKKIAMGRVESDFIKCVFTGENDYNNKTITLNINFVPKRIILTNIVPEKYYFGDSGSSTTGFNITGANIDSDVKNMKSILYYNGSKTRICEFVSVNLTKKEITFKAQGILGEKTEISYNWIAIG